MKRAKRQANLVTLCVRRQRKAWHSYKGCHWRKRNYPPSCPGAQVGDWGHRPHNWSSWAEEVLQGFYGHGTTFEMKVSLGKRTCRRVMKAYLTPKEERALKLLKTTHIKIGWMSCIVRRKTAARRCYHCLVSDHAATDLKGPNRSKGCLNVSVFPLRPWRVH